MKLSLKWINEFVDIADLMAKPDQLSELLVKAGLEVEQIENQGQAFQHVVVGQIVELGRHPKADKLTLCQVDTGEKTPRQIVCGAKNHKQGDKVVVATPGAVLPGDFAIKISKIRDVESQGMLCSESELGFKDESEGIVILPADAPIGRAFAQYWGLDDVLLEISITPNRADCLSHLGLAREISCLLGRPLKKTADPAISEAASGSSKKSNQKKSGSGEKNKITVELRDSDLCPRYTGCSIFGVKIGPSPDWVKRRLESLGVNSINNVVDATNLVMLEVGQPLHAFDLDTLRGGKIIISRSQSGEKFKTFDGSEIALSGEELTIRDSERAVALAGVIGGLNSGVSDSTRNIFLEIANFNPKGVRRTSRRHAIDTDSSYRFSRGVDVNGIDHAMNRAVALICDLAGGTSSIDHVDVYPNPTARPKIRLRRNILTERLGYNVEMPDVVSWMKRLHCEVQGDAQSEIRSDKTISPAEEIFVTPPSFRVDLEIEMDLVEEYGRLNGYDKIQETFPPLCARPTEHAASFINEERVSEYLVQSGFLESRNYAFLSPAWQNEIVAADAFSQVGLSLKGEHVQLRNPLSEETSVMRMSLLPGLIQNLLHNEHRGMQNGRLFEVGRVFIKRSLTADEKEEASAVPGFHEPHRLALIAWGHRQGLWQKPNEPVVFDLKSAIYSLVERLNSRIDFRKVESAAGMPAFLHPAQSATLFYEGRTIGFVGSLHPLLKEQLKIRSDAAVSEIDFTALMRGQPRATKMKAISKFPSVERDFSLVVADTVTAGELVREAEKVIGPLLQNIDVFDVFRGGAVPEGFQSVSIRLTLQDATSTLADERIQAIAQDVLKRLGEKFSAKIRS